MEEFKKVIIKGVDISCIDLGVVLVKLALVAIVAMFIIYLVFSFLTMIFGGFFNIFMFRI